MVDESLARRRPVLIFEDIKHIIKDRKGIFVSKRNIDSFIEITKYIFFIFWVCVADRSD